MTEERIVIDTFDVNNTKANVEEAVERYRAGQPTGQLGWNPIPNAGADATLLDACPFDGSVEIDCYFLEKFGMHIEISAIKYPKAQRTLLTNRRADPPDVLSHAQGIAAALRKRLELEVSKPAGRKPDEWNKRAIQRLLEGEDSEAVRNDWREEFKVGTGAYPADSKEGEQKTWDQRVMQHYRKQAQV
jgi:hypothetical protein